MRKLLSGYLFRFLKSYELWVLIVLYAAASAFLIYTFASSNSFITITRGNYTLRWGDHEEITINKDNINDYKFESLDVSELSLYRYYVGPVPKEDYDAIENSVAIGERNIFWGLIEFLHIVPSVIILILIPFFSGPCLRTGQLRILLPAVTVKARFICLLLFSRSF